MTSRSFNKKNKLQKLSNNTKNSLIKIINGYITIISIWRNGYIVPLLDTGIGIDVHHAESH